MAVKGDLAAAAKVVQAGEAPTEVMATKVAQAV